jgi:hypothetical protein
VRTPRALAAGLVTAMVVACIDFDLDRRRFRCSADPTICGEGSTCGADGYCTTAGDAGPADAPPDTALGEICMNGADDDGGGDIDCADPECPADTTCGTGCVCMGAGPQEVACGDRLDNDGDQLPDCLDPDCPRCMGTLQCCPTGACATTC